MGSATLSLQRADPLRPQPPGGMGQGALLALGVHSLLVVALALAVNWRSQTPQTFSAELWSATPQVAAPRAVESTPASPPPPPPPAPTPRLATPAPPPAVDPQIAVEKARQERERADRLRADREKAEREKQARAEKEKAERDKAERERQAAAKAKSEAQARREQQEQREKQAEEQRLAKQREDNLKRMMGQAGATGAPGSTGTAQKDAAPSASYAGKLIARIKPNILLTETVSGNPSADVEVRSSPTGTILARRLVKPSGNKDWDDAVLRAIDRTAELPRDTDGRVPPVLVITFTP
jgi:colicin import membrane protein